MLGHIKIELISQDKWHDQNCPSKYCVNFVNSSLDNSLRGKKIIINQLLSKLWYIVPIYTIPRYIKKEIEKRIYNFLRNIKKKSDFPDTQKLLGHFRHRQFNSSSHSIKFSKNKIDSKIIKSHQCSLFNPTNALQKDLILY